MEGRVKTLATILLVAYLAFFIYLTLFLKFSLGVGAPVNLIPFAMMAHDITVGGADFLVNFLGNLGVFIPVGLLLPVILGPRSSILRVLLIGSSFSGAIEFAQWVSGRRVADVDDVILNTTGAMIGYAIWAVGRRILGLRSARSRGQNA